MSSFSGLHVGLSSLYAQRAGLELAGHNIANANTEGYTRQRVDLAANGGPVTPAMHSRYDKHGDGVRVADVTRMRDAFLESRALQERGVQSELAAGQLVLGRVEGLLGEPSESGIASSMSALWSGFDAVGNKPTDGAARAQLLQRAQTLASGVNAALDAVGSQRASFQEQLSTTVADLNSTAASIAEYNRVIVSATRGGAPANDLKDQRDLLVQRLGESAGARAVVGADGAVDVYLGGRALVSGRDAATLTASAPGATPSTVTWSSDGATAPVGGTAGGLLTGVNTTLPRYASALREVAVQLHDTVNAQHQAGYDAAGASGGPLFALDAAGRLSVAVTDPAKVAAGRTASAGGDTDGGNALVLGAFASKVGGPDATYRSLIGTLGVEAQTANRRVDIQTAIVSQVDAARESQSGVSIDEEMTNMLAFQRAYEGAARFVSAVDQMLDTLINRTGLVGR